MLPELPEYEVDSRRPDGDADRPPGYVGAPSEFADEAEAPAVVQNLATIAAGVGLAAPFLVVGGLLMLSCLACVLLIALAAGLG